MKRCANCSRPIRMSNGRWWHSETGVERCAMEFWAIPVEAPSRATNRHILPVGRFADTVSGGAP